MIRLRIAETLIFVSLQFMRLAKAISPKMFDSFLEMLTDMYIKANIKDLT
jgi:hypothetical protein